jgi:hypothetical protein
MDLDHETIKPFHSGRIIGTDRVFSRVFGRHELSAGWRYTTHFNVVEACLHLSYIIVICQLTATPAVFYDRAIMEPPDACRHAHHLSHPPGAAAPASAASHPGCAGGARRLDELRRPTRRHRHEEQATTAEAYPDGTVSGSGVYDTSGGPFASVMTWKDARKVPGRCGNTDLVGADELLCFAVNETSHYREYSDGISSLFARRGLTFPSRPRG